MLDVLCRRGGGIRIGFDARDIFRDVPGALRRVLGIARNLLGRGALLFDRGRNRGRDLIDLADERLTFQMRPMAFRSPPPTLLG